MTLTRRMIGKPESYLGRKIVIRHMGPDLLCYVNDVELGGFYTDAKAARDAGIRHVDAEVKAQKEREARERKHG